MAARICKTPACANEVAPNAWGRPRLYCDACREKKPGRRTNRVQVDQAARWARENPDRHRELREAANRRYRARLAIRDQPVCGCGRDYAEVPLEEAHRCPRPAGG